MNSEKKVNLYGHYGSHNHGNEAIVRGFAKLLDDIPFVLYSYNPGTDFEFKLDEICEINHFIKKEPRFSISNLRAKIYSKISGQSIYTFLIGDFVKNREKLFLFEAGDQYCETNVLSRFYAGVNKKLAQSNKIVALPCTIDESRMQEREFKSELKDYSLIFARESITYKALQKAGLAETTRFSPCPAFLMESKKTDLPGIFDSDTVALTVGHLAQGKESLTQNLVENTRQLIKFILKSTDYNIALVPHVNVGSKLSDVIILKELKNEFSSSQRISLIPEQRADCLKYIISQCRLLVTLRTHASIAGYSSCVPTLVIGYSQKSKGIAWDLFGTYENYVVDVHSMDTKDRLVNAFVWLEENKKTIKSHLERKIPEYQRSILKLKDEISMLLEESNV